MTAFDDFLTGKTVGHYVDGKEHLYRIDLEKVKVIFRDYFDDYNDLSTISRHTKNEAFGFYIPSVEVLVCDNDYHLKNLENTKSNFKILYSDNVKKEILSQVEKAMWKHDLIVSQMTTEAVDAAYEELSADFSMYTAFLNGQDSLNINITSSIINGYRRTLSNQDVYDYLVNPQKTIDEQLDFCIEHFTECGTNVGLKEAVYQRYKALHTAQGSFKKELVALDLLNGELSHTKTLWLHLKNGERKQVQNNHRLIDNRLSGKGMMIGYYNEVHYVDDVQAIEYSRKVYPLTTL